MKIEELSKLKSASRFGTCGECHVASGTHELYRIKLNSESICLCRECFERLMTMMTIINDFWEEGEDE